MRAWRWERGGRGRIAAWREVLLVGLSSGQGWSEPRRGGFVGIEDGGGICSGKEYVRGSRADGEERRRCCEGGLCERWWWGRGLWWRKV